MYNAVPHGFPVCRPMLVYLTEILFGEVGIDMLGRRYCIGLECDEEIDCTPVQLFCKHLAYNKFLIFRQKGGLDVDISSLAVQRSDFYGQFAAFRLASALPYPVIDFIILHFR